MKKIFITIFPLLFYASIALADAVDDRLPPETPDQLKASTRQMIQAGLNIDAAVKMTRSMLENDFTTDNTLKAQQIIMNAHRQGLPIEPLENKAFEGMTKNVKADRIVRALEIVLSRYAFAYERAAVLSTEKQQINRLGNTLAAGLAAGLNHQDAANICSTLQNRAQNMNSTEHDDEEGSAGASTRGPCWEELERRGLNTPSDDLVSEHSREAEKKGFARGSSAPDARERLHSASASHAVSTDRLNNAWESYDNFRKGASKGGRAAARTKRQTQGLDDRDAEIRKQYANGVAKEALSESFNLTRRRINTILKSGEV